jgi:glycyl-tRNA synthetase
LTDILKIKKENLRLREHQKTELSHYSSATFDIDYFYPFVEIGENKGRFKELCGIANRGNYDLSKHAEFSKKNLFMKNKEGENIHAHVIEPSIGLDRLFMALLCDAYEFDKERDYVVLHLSPKLSPTEYAVFPLFSKSSIREEYTNKAREVFNFLIDKGYRCIYDQSGSIGKRYARQDEVGTFSCITVDETSLLDNTITIRNRDTKEQIRRLYSEI